MPIKKKNKIRNRIIFWLVIAIIGFLMIYVPNPPGEIDGGDGLEYELH